MDDNSTTPVAPTLWRARANRHTNRNGNAVCVQTGLWLDGTHWSGRGKFKVTIAADRTITFATDFYQRKRPCSVRVRGENLQSLRSDEKLSPAAYWTPELPVRKHCYSDSEEY